MALTPADVDTVARTYYRPDLAADALTGHGGRRHPVEHVDGRGITFLAGPRGLQVTVHADPPRAGLVPWRDLEAVLTRHATPAAARALVRAVHTAARHPGREAARDAVDAALAALRIGHPAETAQLDLFGGTA